jgi:hypothetical protein
MVYVIASGVISGGIIVLFLWYIYEVCSVGDNNLELVNSFNYTFYTASLPRQKSFPNSLVHPPK